MRSFMFSLLGLCMVLSVSASAIADSHKERAAVVAAQAWLNKVDQGKYAESWNDAAQYFKNAIQEEE